MAVNVGTTITKAVTKMPGSLPRPQFVTWFNEIVRDILGQPRVWKFLTEPSTIAIVNNQITIPATMSEITLIVVGDHYFTTSDQLSELDGASADNGAPIQEGYTLTAAGVITFHPALTGSAVVTGEHAITADYADNAATSFPLEFENLFITGLRMHYYDQNKDGRYTKENQQYQIYMNGCKAWDNRQKVRPPFNKNGMIR